MNEEDFKKLFKTKIIEGFEIVMHKQKMIIDILLLMLLIFVIISTSIIIFFCLDYPYSIKLMVSVASGIIEGYAFVKIKYLIYEWILAKNSEN